MEAGGLPYGDVNLALNLESRAGFTLQPRCCIRGDVSPSEAILLAMLDAPRRNPWVDLTFMPVIANA